MQADMTNETHQKSRTETEKASGTSSNVNETAASARIEQAGQFVTWWKEYQKKMKSVLRSSPTKLQMQE